MLDVKLSNYENVLHTQFFVHLSDHTPLKLTFVISKGKSLKIVDSDEDYNSTSDEEVKEFTPKRVLSNSAIDIAKKTESDEVTVTNVKLESKEHLEQDKELGESEKTSFVSESAPQQEGPVDLTNGININISNSHKRKVVT